MTRPMKKTKKEPEPKKEPLPYNETELPIKGIIDEDDFIEQDYRRHQDDNPFRELETLVTGQGIDLKTLLTERQVVVMHKLSTLQKLYEEEGITEASTLIEHFATRFMTLIINKDGLSRSQYIEAIGKGRERAEESRREKLADKMGTML